MSRSLWAAILVLLVLVSIAGCGKKEEQVEKKAPAATEKQVDAQIVVPAIVEGKWRAVKIVVLDKETGKEDLYKVDIGAGFNVPGSSLSLRVTTFLPHFVHDGKVQTSKSNALENPAARIVVSDGGKEIFRGWLFGLYPSNHDFQHPRYSFSLIDFVPAG